ncbi:MAG TPA: class I SAM-dependent methyltransferase [Micromonosporaceae bacterium]|nr:class I SAM-dependent methyltransferase [Micromonosporaceae bacterium]
MRAGPRGGAVPHGTATRGTTSPNRLRRVDRWIIASCGETLRAAADPLVVDLGYGATPVTTVELRNRLATALRPDVRVVGLEIDPVRVAEAQPVADPPRLEFRHGGFELAGLRPVVVRAMNVLRQYPEAEVPAVWQTMAGQLAPGGRLVEGTCDEVGRLATWVALRPDGPVSLTLSVKLSTLDTPGTVAERLPKALIHRNVPGELVHELLGALDHAWLVAAPYAGLGARQRWLRAVAAVRDAGWPVLDRPVRWRLGEVTIAWRAVAPENASTPA